MKLRQYIFELLGVDLRLQPLKAVDRKKLPLYLMEIYNLKRGSLFGREVMFLEQKTQGHFTAGQYHKQITHIENTFNMPAVLVLEQLEAYNRKRLIKRKIAFIIPGLQMYIPQLLVDLREFRTATQKKKEKLQPAAQCLLLYHLEKEGVENMNFKEIAHKVNYTQMTVTRGVRELAAKQLCRIEGTNGKRLVFDEDREIIWNRALPYLQNPVKEKIYTDDFIDEQLLFKSGMNALSRLTELTDGPQECFAIAQRDYNDLLKHKRITAINRYEGRVCLEIWRYAPAILAENRIVDTLSLYLIFKDIRDERVEKEIEKMVSRVW